jgi:hypothetical protein
VSGTPIAEATWPHGDPRTVIRAVLGDPRFRSAPQRAGEKTWLDYLIEGWERFWTWIAQPFRHMSGGGTIATVVGILILIAVLLVVMALLMRLADGALSRRAVRRAASSSALAADRDAGALLDDASAAGRAGRYRDAAVLLWASALRAFDERGRVRFDPARSPGEWRRAVGDAAFDALARDAVVALFGDRAIDAAFFERMRAAYDRAVARA